MKKIKLFTTIASLCLAVALMAFGVYAASSQTFNVSATINYDIGYHIAGTVTVSAYDGLTEAKAPTGEAKQTANATFDGNATSINQEGKLVLTATTDDDKLVATQEAKVICFAVNYKANDKNSQAVKITLTEVTTPAGFVYSETEVTTAGTDVTAYVYYTYNAEGLEKLDDKAVEFTVKVFNPNDPVNA